MNASISRTTASVHSIEVPDGIWNSAVKIALSDGGKKMFGTNWKPASEITNLLCTVACQPTADFDNTAQASRCLPKTRHRPSPARGSRRIVRSVTPEDNKDNERS